MVLSFSSAVLPSYLGWSFTNSLNHKVMVWWGFLKLSLFIGVTDFEAAFDYISRRNLFIKLTNLGIGMFLLNFNSPENFEPFILISVITSAALIPILLTKKKPPTFKRINNYLLFFVIFFI